MHGRGESGAIDLISGPVRRPFFVTGTKGWGWARVSMRSGVESGDGCVGWDFGCVRCVYGVCGMWVCPGYVTTLGGLGVVMGHGVTEGACRMMSSRVSGLGFVISTLKNTGDRRFPGFRGGRLFGGTPTHDFRNLGALSSYLRKTAWRAVYRLCV